MWHEIVGGQTLVAVAFRIALAAHVFAALAACAGLPRNPVPLEMADQTKVLGPAPVRFWGDEAPKNLNAILREKLAQMRVKRPHLVKPGATPRLSFLLISGGGSDGAFGAGLLAGWSARGTRPEFELVTGISTGALSAPFAFLGPKYDAQLKEMYTTYTTRDFVKKQPVRGLLGGASLASSQPLANLISHYADENLLKAIAREHRRGRRLLIGTTNLDAQRPVIWDMGQIATSGHPQALQLFRNVLLASASIPGAFPPVKIEVDVNGTVREELHVDGGTTKQVFFLPTQIMARRDVDQVVGFNPSRRLYIIRNGRIDPEFKVVKASTLSIAERSISTLIKNQGIGDLVRLYGTARRNGMSYNLAYIPGNFPDTSTEVFDRPYMNKLYDLAYGLGKNGYRWAKSPPGFGSR